MQIKRIGLGLACLGALWGCEANLPDMSQAPIQPTQPCRELERTEPQAPVPTPRDDLPLTHGQGRALAWTGRGIVLTDPDNGALVEMDTGGGVLARLEVGDRPELVVVGPDGMIYASTRGDGRIVKVRPGLTAIQSAVALGAAPAGLAMSPDGAVLYVGLEGKGALLALDAATLEERGRVEGLGDPRAALAAPDGRVFVSTARGAVHALESRRVDDPGDGGWRVALTQTHRHTLRTSRPLEKALNARPRATAQRHALSMAWRPGHRDVLVSHSLVHPGDPQESTLRALGRAPFDDCFVSRVVVGYYGEPTTVGPSNTRILSPFEAAVSAVGNDAAPLTAAPPLDSDVTLGAMLALPVSIDHHPRWSAAFVTGFSSDNILVFNTRHPDPMSNVLALINVGQAPRGVIFDGSGRYAYVLNAHSHSLGVIDLEPMLRAFEAGTETVPVTTLRQGADWIFSPNPLSETMQIGRRLFTHARQPETNGNGVFACAACHLEGGSDHLVWFGPEGPRRTTALGAHLRDSAPYDWKGDGHSLEANLRKTITRLGGRGLDHVGETSLALFITEGLPAPLNPHRAAEGLTEAQRRGQAIFEASCASCHQGPAMTDGAAHDIDTISPMEQGLSTMGVGHQRPELFNTPSLQRLHEGGPFFHDGRAATLRDVLEHKQGHLPDHVAAMSPEQLDDLEAFLLTL